MASTVLSAVFCLPDSSHSVKVLFSSTSKPQDLQHTILNALRVSQATDIRITNTQGDVLVIEPLILSYIYNNENSGEPLIVEPLFESRQSVHGMWPHVQSHTVHHSVLHDMSSSSSQIAMKSPQPSFSSPERRPSSLLSSPCRSLSFLSAASTSQTPSVVRTPCPSLSEEILGHLLTFLPTDETERLKGVSRLFWHAATVSIAWSLRKKGRFAMGDLFSASIRGALNFLGCNSNLSSSPASSSPQWNPTMLTSFTLADAFFFKDRDLDTLILSCPRLKELNLFQAKRLSTEAVERIPAHWTALERLTITECSVLRWDFVQLVCRNLTSTLQHLVLDFCRIDTGIVWPTSDFVSSVIHDASLDLSYHEQRPEMQSLPIFPHLRHLSVQENALLGNFLAFLSPSLLSYRCSFPHARDEFWLRRLAVLVQRCPKLRILWPDSGRIQELELKFLVAFARDLQEVGFVHAYFSEPSALERLTVLRRLKHVCFSNCTFPYESDLTRIHQLLLMRGVRVDIKNPKFKSLAASASPNSSGSWTGRGGQSYDGNNGEGAAEWAQPH